MKSGLFFKLVLILALALAGCSGGDAESAAPQTQAATDTAAPPPPEPTAPSPATETLPPAVEETVPAPVEFALASSAFEAGQQIPARYTCDGEDISPPLAWSGAPAGTESFALILDDPDAPIGTFTHWVLFDLPADVNELAEGASSEAALGPHQGKTSWGKAGYGGPCPPSGVHHYIFTLYAVDSLLDLPAGASKKELLSALEGQILAQVELAGLYGNP